MSRCGFESTTVARRARTSQGSHSQSPLPRIDCGVGQMAGQLWAAGYARTLERIRKAGKVGRTLTNQAILLPMVSAARSGRRPTAALPSFPSSHIRSCNPMLFLSPRWQKPEEFRSISSPSATRYGPGLSRHMCSSPLFICTCARPTDLRGRCGLYLRRLDLHGLLCALEGSLLKSNIGP
mgnify:FL=1